MSANPINQQANLINLRMKQCPYYPGLNIQQIIGYGRWKGEVEKKEETEKSEVDCATVNPIAVNPFLIIFAKLFKPEAPMVKKFLRGIRLNFRDALYKLFESSFRDLPILVHKNLLGYENKEKYENEHQVNHEIKSLQKRRSKLDGKYSDKRILFSIIDWDDLIKSGSFPLRAELKDYKPPEKEERYDFSRIQPSKKPVDFAMTACIRDKPGTLHSILEVMTPSVTGDSEENTQFCFNIDYLITDYLGVYNLYHIELYGSYISCGNQKADPKQTNSKIKENVQGIVFYRRPEENLFEQFRHSATYRQLTKCFNQDGFNLRYLDCSDIRSNLEYHLDPHGNSQLISPLNKDNKNNNKDIVFGDVKVTAFHRDKDIGIDDGRRFPPVINCPISRVAGCPGLERVLSHETIDKPKTYPVKFHVIMQDWPGALKTFIELVGKGDFPRT